MILDVGRTLAGMAATEKNFEDARIDMAHLLYDIGQQTDAEIEKMRSLAAEYDGQLYTAKYRNAIFDWAKMLKSYDCTYPMIRQKMHTAITSCVDGNVLSVRWMDLFCSMN